MPEDCDAENRPERRLRAYARLLREDSPCGRAVRQTERAARLSVDTRLYLYGFVPAIMEFAGWVLEEAVRSGRKRLYFLSRDGYQIYLAACKLVELRKLPVECRYLYVSRYAMRVPAYHLDMDGCLDRICSGGLEVTLERILRRAALTEEEACEVARRIGRRETYREVLNRSQTAELKEILGREPQFLQRVKEHSMEAYENAMGYLQQEGLLSAVPYAIVDSGWVGTCQQTLQRLLQSRMPDIRVEGYYFGLYEIPVRADAQDYHGWYFSPRTGLNRKVHFSNSLFEAVCSAEQGMTVGYGRENGVCSAEQGIVVGYDRENGRYLPQLDPAGNPNGAFLRRSLEALQSFLEIYGGSGEVCGKTAGTCGVKHRFSIRRHFELFGARNLVKKRFTLLMARPSLVETESYGGLFFSEDVLTGNDREVAAPLRQEEIRDLYILRRLAILNGWKKGNIHESAWAEGSIVRCGSNIRKNLRHTRWYKYLVYGRKQCKAWLRTIIIRWERSDH